MDDGRTVPVVELPERLDRPLRLGPFPSGRAALKFVGFAAAGAVVVPVLGGVAWLPFLGAGAVVALWRPDGDPVDERLLRLVRWTARRRSRALVTGPRRAGRRSAIRWAGGLLALVRVGGIPLAYLPPGDLAARFDSYRELLRACDSRLVVAVTRTAIHPVPYLPAEPAPPAPEGTARAGYRELVEVILRRRHLRHVYVGVTVDGADTEATQLLESRVGSLTERLRGLDLRPTRLRDHALAEAAHRVGIAVVGEVP